MRVKRHPQTWVRLRTQMGKFGKFAQRLRNCGTGDFGASKVEKEGLGIRVVGNQINCLKPPISGELLARDDQALPEPRAPLACQNSN